MKVFLVTAVQSFSSITREFVWFLGSGNTLLIQFVFLLVLVVSIPLIFESSESIEFYVFNERMSFCFCYTHEDFDATN